MKQYVRIVTWLSQAGGVVAMLLLAAAVLVVTEMVLVRYLLRGSTVWQTEFVVYALVAATFIGSPYVLLHKGHVNVDLLPSRLGRRGRFWLGLLSGSLSLLFCALLAWSGWQHFHEAWAGGWTTDTIWALPLWIPLLPLPLGIGLLCLQYVAELWKLREEDLMSPLMMGLLVLLALLALLATGMPIAFALGLVSIGSLILVDGWGSMSILGETFFGALASFGLVSIPMFILMGSAVASSPAGKDLYEALDRWLNRVPGGLVLSNLGACAIFAALSGSSPATCAAIGKMGIPEMMKRGYPKEIATGSIAAGGTLGILIPPSITMIVYGIATETSIGRLFIAGILPGLLLTMLFMVWTLFSCHQRGIGLDQLATRFTLRQKIAALPRVLPFLAIIVGILYVLYGGVATPSEAAGVGALFCLILVVLIYRMWQVSAITTVFRSTIRESVMIMMIIGASEIFSFALSSMFVTQSIAEWIAALEVNRWALMGIINLFLLVAGFFLPPVAVILMTAPVLLPIIIQAGFDPYWFAVVLTINMEIGLITPPVGLNLYVIKGIAPLIELQAILRGSLPYVLCMVLAIVILCIFPGIVTWLPNLLMGAAL